MTGVYHGQPMRKHPDECIDCGVCEPERPAEAILPDSEPGLESWLKLNADYAAKYRDQAPTSRRRKRV